MGFFDNSNRLPTSKEIEFDVKCDGNVIISALEASGLKTRLVGDTIKVSNKFFAKCSVAGTITNINGKWTGSIILTGKPNCVVEKSTEISVNLKKFRGK